MTASQVKVGGVYLAKVSNRIVEVRLDKIDSIDMRQGTMGLVTKRIYRVTNLRTGRQTSFRSASKFRSGTLSPEEKARRAALTSPPQIPSATS